MSAKDCLYTPYRSIGYICDRNPFTLNRLGEEMFLTATIGNCFQIFRLSHKMAVCLVSRPYQSDESNKTRRIAALQVAGHETYTAVGNRIVVYSRTSIVRTHDDHAATIIGLLCIGKFLFSYDEKNNLKIFDLKKREKVSEMRFLGSSTISSLIHPATYINKFLVGFSDGRLELWNFNSRKLIYQYKSLVPYLSKSTTEKRARKARVNGLQLVELADSDDDNDDAALSGGMTAYITCMESSPAVDVVAVGCSNGAILLLHLKLDQVMFAFQQSDGAVTSLTFRTDSESVRYPFLVSSSPQGRLHIWNLGSRSSTTPPDVDNDSDGDGDGDATNVRPLERKLQCSVDDAHRGCVSRVSFLPGEPIMVSAGHDNCLRMWIFDQDGSGSELPCRLLRSREGHCGHPIKIRFIRAPSSSDADAQSFELVSAGSDASMRLFNTVTDAGSSREMSQKQVVQKMAGAHGLLGRNNQRLPECIGFDVAETRERDWGNMVSIHRGHCAAYVWKVRHRTITEMILMQPQWSNPTINRLSGRLLDAKSVAATAVTISSCGHFCMVGHSGGQIFMYNLQSGQPRQSFPINRNVQEEHEQRKGGKGKSTFGPGNVFYEEKQMLNESMVVYPTEKKRPGAADEKGHTDEVTGMVVDITNSVLVSCSLDGQLIFWNLHSHAMIEAVQVGCPLTMLLAHKEAGFVAVGGLDAVIRLYDMSTHVMGRRFSHESLQKDVTQSTMRRLLDLSFSPDGRRLLTSAEDCTVRIWDIPTGRCLNWLLFSAPVMSMTVSPNGEQLCIALADTDKDGMYMYIDRSLYETVHFWKEPDRPTFLADSLLQADQEDDEEEAAVDEDAGQGQGPVSTLAQQIGDDAEQEQKRIDEIEEDVTQKSSGCITLSQIPRAHWVSLFQLEAIKLRSKPLAPPNKKPVLAPFFLPSVVAQGSATPSFPTSEEYQKMLKKKGLPEEKDDGKLTQAIEQDQDIEQKAEELPSVWADDTAEEFGWTIDTSRDDSALLNVLENEDSEALKYSSGAMEEHHANTTLPPGEDVAPSESEAKAGHRYSKSKIFGKKTTLPRCKIAMYLHAQPDLLLDYLKQLSAPAIDVQLRALYSYEGDQEGEHNLQLLLNWLAEKIETGQDFELLQAYLHRILTIFDKAMITLPELAETVQKVKAVSETASDRFRHLLHRNLCMFKTLANIPIS